VLRFGLYTIAKREDLGYGYGYRYVHKAKANTECFLEFGKEKMLPLKGKTFKFSPLYLNIGG